MGYRPNWKLMRPQPLHYKLAELIAYGFGREECMRLTGLSTSFIARLWNSPIFQGMVREERAKVKLAREMEREREGLEAARKERPYDLSVVLDLAEITLLREFVQIRDGSENVGYKLKACIEINRQLERLRKQPRNHL